MQTFRFTFVHPTRGTQVRFASGLDAQQALSSAHGAAAALTGNAWHLSAATAIGGR